MQEDGALDGELSVLRKTPERVLGVDGIIVSDDGDEGNGMVRLLHSYNHCKSGMARAEGEDPHRPVL